MEFVRAYLGLCNGSNRQKENLNFPDLSFQFKLKQEVKLEAKLQASFQH